MFRILSLVVIALVFATGTVFSQESPRWSVDFMLDVGRVSTDYTANLRPNWQKDFQPPGGNMKINVVEQSRSSSIIRIGFSYDLLRTESGWRLRLPISKQLVRLTGGADNSFGQERLASTMANWWDPVTVSDVVIKRSAPRFGLEVVRGPLMIGVSAQYYTLMERQYRGVDCYGCRNTSEVISSKNSNGISPRLEFFLGPFGAFYEFTSSKAANFGFTLRIRSSDIMGM
jgi:hypothetical protein